MQTSELLALNTGMKASIATIDLNSLIPQSGGLSKGAELKIVDFGYVQTTLPLGVNGQTIDLGNGTPKTVIAGNTEEAVKEATVARQAGDDAKWNALTKAISLSFSFEDKSTVAISALRRSALTKIDSKNARAYSGADFAGMIGKTLVVNEVSEDASVSRTNNQTGRVTMGKAYIITTKA